VLDYGGGDGSLISTLTASRKISYEFSGISGVPGVEVISTRAELPSGIDLISCAQVLEHISDPSALLEDMASLLRPGGMLYLEVPNQIWRAQKTLKPKKKVLSWLCRHSTALLAADIYSTFFRIKFGFLPPMGFVPMREHINFFTPSSLQALAQKSNYVPLAQ
jgi:SAM-dependent methyltransferase